MQTRTDRALEFLAHLIGEPPEGSCLELRVKKNDEKGTRQHFLPRLKDLDLAAFTPAEHVWYGPAFRKLGTSTGKADDVTTCSVLWADFDKVESKDGLVVKLKRWELPPSYIVDSGGGIHAYWKLDRPLNLQDAGQRSYFREVIHGVAAKLGGDLSVHDPSRVFGLPGTYNAGNGRTKVYDPPREIRVLSDNPGRMFNVGDLSRHRKPIVDSSGGRGHISAPTTPAAAPEVLRVSSKIRALIKDGAENGKRSEADMAVMCALTRHHTDDEIFGVFMDPQNGIGAKYRDLGADGPRYLARTLAAAHAFTAPTITAVIREEGGNLQSQRGKTWETIYNRTVRAIAKLTGEAAGYRVSLEGGDSELRTLDAEAFSSNVAFKRALGGVGSWTGNDREVQLMITHLESQNPPKVPAVTTIGWHGKSVVFPNAQLVDGKFDNATDYLYLGKLYNARLEACDDWDTLARTLADILPVLHSMGPMVQLVGWFLATFAAPMVRRASGGGFPLLMVFGTPEAGKTTLLEALWRLCGMGAALHSSTDTKFANVELLASSNTLPVVFDEHRRTDVNRYKSHLYPALREAFNGGVQSRGQKDLTVARYHLTAPVAVAGETPFRDQALLDRTIHIKLERAGKNPDALRALNALPIEQFNAGFYQHVAGLDVPALWLGATKLLPPELRNDGMNERQKIGWTAVALGLLLFEPFWSRDQVAEWVRGFQETKVATGEDMTISHKAVVYETVRVMFELIKSRSMQEGREFTITNGQLRIVPALVLPLVEEYYTHTPTDLPMGKEAILGRLREDVQTPNAIVVDFRKVMTLGRRSVRGITFDLKQVEAELDIPFSAWGNEMVDGATEL